MAEETRPHRFRVFRPEEAEQRLTAEGARCRVYPSGIVFVDADAHRLWDQVCLQAGVHLSPASVVAGDDAEASIVAIRPAREGESGTIGIAYTSRSRGFRIRLRALLRNLNMQVPRGQRWSVPVAIDTQDPEFGPCLVLQFGQRQPVVIARREPASPAEAAAARMDRPTP